MSISGSELPSFDRLHPEIRRWIRDQGWAGLRPIQDRAIRAILDGDTDVVVMAGTASGKTEAAFLPLLTKAAETGPEGLRLLYVSPLKALINDQHRRLELLCDRLEMRLTRWHGDAPAGPKSRLLRQPGGVALITPESIEALLLRRPAEAARLFKCLEAVVIDELHAFLQGPRGLQLSSLLRRVDALCDVRPRRVGLSATLGDEAEAKRWLNPQAPELPVVLRSDSSGSGLKLQVRGYEDPPEPRARAAPAGEELEPDALKRIGDHLFQHLRGSNNLVFAGSRARVELLADGLRERCVQEGVPEEFFPHHGSLAKELRETLELRLKAGDLPTTAVATTTLELGIDLGEVRSVAQVGAPKSLAGLRQRLGRSGRRGCPAILRIYVREPYLASDAHPVDRLRLETIRAVAAVRLLLEGFVEPPMQDAALATVVLHQTLATIASTGGIRPAAAHAAICGSGSILAMAPADYADLLRGAAREGTDLIEQSPDGLLMLGPTGERLVEGRDFYAVFATDEEWRLVAGGRPLGSLPIANMLGVGSLVLFAGRRWRVEAVDDRAKTLDVVPHRAGQVPKFDPGSGEPIHDRLAQCMRKVLEDSDDPAYLDPHAKEFLTQARSAYRELSLERRNAFAAGRDAYLMTWCGTSVNSLLAVLVRAVGIDCEVEDVGIVAAGTSPDELLQTLAQIDECPPLEELSGFVENVRGAKLDAFVDEDLLRRLWCRRHGPVRPQITNLLQRLRLRAEGSAP